MSARRKAESLILATSSGQDCLRISQSGERKTGLRMSQSGRRRQSTHKPVYVTGIITRTKTGTNRPIDEGAGDSPAPLINDN